jgi:thiamine pyrophosphokinase
VPPRQTGRGMETEKRCILVGAGPLGETAIDRLPDDIVIAVDGGLKYLADLGMLPDYLLGDFDSLEESQYPLYEEYRRERPDRVIRLPVEKDDTDMHAAVKKGLELGCTKFLLYGAAGGRIDHTIANIQTMLYARRHGAEAYMIEGGTMLFVLEKETRRFRRGLGGLFSLFSLEGRCRVSIEGMRYPLQDAVITNDFPIGTSNEFIPEKEASVTLKEGSALAVYISGGEAKHRIPD